MGFNPALVKLEIYSTIYCTKQYNETSISKLLSYVLHRLSDIRVHASPMCMKCI